MRAIRAASLPVLRPPCVSRFFPGVSRTVHAAVPVAIVFFWLTGSAAAQAGRPPAAGSGNGDGKSPAPPPVAASTAATTSQTALAEAGPDSALLHSVISTALEFLTPRTLQPHTAQQFSLWGLGGLSATDPVFSVVEDPAGLRLMKGQTILLTRPVPASDDIRGWTDVDAALLTAAWNASGTIRASGYDGLVQSFFDELFNHLDPYSRYVAPSPAETDREARDGDLGGAGLTFGTGPAPSRRRGAHSRIVVTAVNTNGPAWAAGVDVGDTVLAVDGQSVSRKTPAEVGEMVRGKAGTTLRLKLAMQPHGHIRTLTFRREQVPPETVFAYTSGSLMILRITSFSAETAEEMSQYIDQASQSKDFHGLILDLRGNRGGVLQQAVTAAALLLDHGVAVITKGRDPQANHIWAVQGGDMTGGIPVVILVDGRTASAAEILAAALADHRRAVVIGSATLGKGLVQTVAQLPDRGELFVTWSRVIAPGGWPLQGLGVMPQLCTSHGIADAQKQLDALKAGHPADASAVTAARAVRYPVPVPHILEIRRSCPAALGGDTDLEAARAVLENNVAYTTALEMIPDDSGNVSENE